MRKIDMVVVHCSATKPSQDIDSETIRQWHLERGWSDIGYHYVIKRNGEIEEGRPINKAGAHAKGFNGPSIGICLVGGINESGKSDANFTVEQYSALKKFLDDFSGKFPGSSLWGHRDLPGVSKDCPCFDVQSFYDSHH